MADRVFLNRAEEITYDRAQRDKTERGTIVPYTADAQGKNHWGLPAWLTSIYDAVRLPADTIEGYQPKEKDISNFANTVGLGGMSASKFMGHEVDANTLGMFLGVKSKNADLNLLEHAKEMEKGKVSRDDIWRNTGWFRGLDKKWKYEIPDNNMKLTPEAEAALGPGESIEGPTDKIVRHDELFNNYPDAPIGHAPKQDPSIPFPANAPLTKVERLSSDATVNGGGGYTPGIEHIEAFGKTTENILDTLSHEFQHAVQNQEGFEPGFNIRDAEKNLDDLRKELTPDAQDYLFMKYKVNERQNVVDLFPNKHNRENLKISEEELKRVEDKIPTTLRGVFDPIFEVISTGNYPRTPFEHYQRQAGEMEAEAVKNRRTLSPEDRYGNIAPWESYPHPEKEGWTPEEITRRVVNLRAALAQHGWEQSAQTLQGP